MVEVVRELRSAGFESAILWVREAAARARGFYAALGWQIDGPTKRELIGEADPVQVRYRRRLESA